MKKRFLAIFFAFCMILNLSFAVSADTDSFSVMIPIDQRIETNDGDAFQTSVPPTSDYKAEKFIAFNNKNYNVFSVTVPIDGKYKVIVRCGTNQYPVKVRVSIYDDELGDYTVLINEKQLSKTGGYHYIQNHEIGVVELEEGTHKIKFENIYSDGYLAGVGFELIAPLGISSVKANGETVSENGTVPRGADSFEITLNQAYQENTVNKDTVYISDGENKLSSVVSVLNGVVSLKLKETLKFGTDYTIYVDGVVADNSIADDSFGFTTTEGNSGDKGTASLSAPDISISGGVVNAEGYMYGSDGLTIEGREVYLYVISPDGDGDNDYVESALTDENGKYSFEYPLPDNAESGIYTIAIGGEYIANANRVSDTALFVSPATERDILDAIYYAIDSETAADCFSTYETELGINLETDLADIESTDIIFGNLAGNEYTTVSALINAYYAEILTVKINNGDENTVDEIISGEENRDILGIDKEKYNALEESTDDFVDAIYNLDKKSNSVAMSEAIVAILDNILAEKFVLKPAVVEIDDLEVFSGNSLEIPISFTESQTNVKNIKLILSSSVFYANDIEFDSEIGAEIFIDGNNAVITLDSEIAITSIETLGTIKIKNLTDGKAELNISGTVLQIANGLEIPVAAEETVIDITVYPKKDGFIYESAESSVISMTLDDKTDSYLTESEQMSGDIKYVGIHNTNKNWIEFDVEVAETGEYRFITFAGVGSATYSPKVEITALKEGESEYKKLASGALNYTGAWTTFADHYVGTVSLEKGSYTFRIACTYADVYFAALKIAIASDIGVSDIVVGDLSLLKTDEVKRGSDVIEISFSSALANDTATNKTIKLMESDKEIPIVVSQNLNKAILYLNETLDYNKQYSIMIDGVCDEYNSSEVLDAVFNFVTLSKNNDAGSAEISNIKGKMLYETATIKGTLLGSKGQTMSGRNVSLYIKNGQSGAVATSVTDDNGNFEIIYSLSKDSTPGAYTFLIGSDYIVSGNRAECILNYVTLEQGTEIVAELNNSDNASDVEKVLKENETTLMLDLEKDLMGLTYPKKVFEHIANKEELKDVAEFYDFYQKAIIAETINQTSDSSVIAGVFKKEDNLELLGIEKNRYDLLVDGKETFLGNVNSLEEITDVDILVEKVNELFETALADEYSKENSSVNADDTTIYVGYSATVNLGLTEAVVGANKVEFIIKSTDGALLEDIELKDVAQGTINSELITSDTLRIIFEPEKPHRELLDVATLYLAAAEKSGEVNLTISGTVEYPITADGEVAKAIINEKNILVTINSKPNNNNNNSGGGSTREPSGVTRVPDNTSPGTDIPITPPNAADEEPFSDLSSVEWAKESILKLHELNIISDSEDKKFNPNNPVKKEELVKMLVLALKLELTGECTLNDVDKNAWYYKYVSASQHHGLVLGNDEGDFGIGTNLSRQDLCVIIVRAIAGDNIQSNISSKFADDNLISDYALDAVYWLKDNGMIDGVGDNKFAPKEHVTRAMAAKLIASVLSFADGEDR